MANQLDTIVAVATPPGKGGVAIVRLSGDKSHAIAKKILQKDLKPRQASYLPFYDQNNQQIDQGIAIYFKNPHSFTGEDVVELHAHGGPIIVDLIIEVVLTFGAKLAEPGEFSKRAFLNDKMDLIQAEAIADLINSGSKQAAASAIRSLAGEFSRQIKTLVEKVINLRMYVEAAIDFPEEEIDFLADEKITEQINEIISKLKSIQKNANQGSLLREGIKVVIAGKPNAGKSSLLNVLSGKESAIVTDIEGTTRDVLTEYIDIDGLPLHLVDTAGLREAKDKVEQIGIERARKEIQQADVILLVVDCREDENIILQNEIKKYFADDIELPKIVIARNKCDLIEESANNKLTDSATVVTLSALKNVGIDRLKNQLKEIVGFQSGESGVFMARRRHVEAINQARDHVETGLKQLEEMRAGELLAEELKLTQQALNEITGEFTSDDLLGKIFSSFCIGK
ncbi:MAG: tRNA uridine-5-carboxymethylaminomethyl(34) synthesis GTPase MnmE [Gammaproteobacteria bacterium]|nr:tRNA uridine-5-carboxymethylaminomethyl(34) synthesis GTPase MnmE [Gammaproteobacteria bacterium]